jgi:hypothetical protein
LSHSTSPALVHDEFFQDRVSQTICLGWLWTTILLVSASWVARITGMSQWCLASFPNSFWGRRGGLSHVVGFRMEIGHGCLPMMFLGKFWDNLRW